MRLIYVAHPVRPIDGETVRGNAERAEEWLVALSIANPDVAFVAPWTALVRARPDDDADPELRARALRTCEGVARRCDGIVLCGPRVSDGMRREAIACIACGGFVYRLNGEPRGAILAPGSGMGGLDASRALAQYRA